MLTDPSIEKLKAKSASPYDLAVLVSKRARELTDGAQPMVINSLPEIYAAGDPDDESWSRQVLDNCRRCTVKLELTVGEHSLRFIHQDAGIVLQKIEIAQQPSDSFYGYRPTYRT